MFEFPLQFLHQMVIHPGLNMVGNRRPGYTQRQPLSLWNSPSCLFVIEPNNFHPPVSIQTSGSYMHSPAPSIRLTNKYLNTAGSPGPDFPPEKHHQSLQLYMTSFWNTVLCHLECSLPNGLQFVSVTPGTRYPDLNTTCEVWCDQINQKKDDPLLWNSSISANYDCTCLPFTKLNHGLKLWSLSHLFWVMSSHIYALNL